jgi:hypothetical protein
MAIVFVLCTVFFIVLGRHSATLRRGKGRGLE